MALTKAKSHIFNGSFLYVEDYGAVAGDASAAAANTTAIQNALDYASTAGIKVVSLKGDQYYIDNTITLPLYVIFDGEGGGLLPTADQDMVIVGRENYLRNMVLRPLNFSGYTKTACILRHTVAWQGNQSDLTSLQNIKIDMADDEGRGVYFDAVTNGYIQYVRVSDLSIERGNIGLEMDGTGNYCNGNLLHNLVFFDCNTSIKMTTAGGNMFSNVMVEKNNYTSKIELIGSGKNIFTGMQWDDPTTDLDANSHDNTFLVQQSSPYMSSRIDEGNGNRSLFGGGEQVGNMSFARSNDRRNHYSDLGSLEFIDDIVGGLSPYWTQSLAAGTSITYASGFAGAASPNQFLRYANLNTAASGEARLDFNDRMLVTDKHRVNIHKIFRVDQSTTGVFQTGLVDNTGNYGIYMEVDYATHGDYNVRLITNNNGTKTTTDCGSPISFQRWFYTTTYVRDGSVIFRLGAYNQAAGNDSGRVGRGSRAAWETGKLYSIGSFTHTTNIPVDAGMQPFFTITDSTGSPYASLAHFHVASSYRASNN